MKFTKPASAFAVLAVAGALTLTGCSGDDEVVETDEPTVEETAETEAPEEDTPVASGDSPAWAKGSLDVGELVAEGSTDSWDIKVYQVGTGTNPKDSMLVDSDTGENLLPEGEEVVVFNVVYTNISDDTILIASPGDPLIRADDWGYLGGQPGVAAEDFYEDFDVSKNGYDIANFDGEPGDGYPVEPGQSFAGATSILYVAGQAVTAEIEIGVKDENGDLLHDLKEEVDLPFTVN